SPAAALVAARLLDGNLADPVRLTPRSPAEITVVVPVRDRAEQLIDAYWRCVGSTWWWWTPDRSSPRPWPRWWHDMVRISSCSVRTKDRQVLETPGWRR